MPNRPCRSFEGVKKLRPSLKKSSTLKIKLIGNIRQLVMSETDVIKYSKFRIVQVDMRRVGVDSGVKNKNQNRF
jgi:hypothetical protein